MKVQLIVCMSMVIMAALSAPLCLGAEGPWRNPRFHAMLQNDALRVDFQAGVIIRMTDRRTGQVLIDTPVEELPGTMAVFGKRGIDLDACQADQRASRSRVETIFAAPDGTRWTLAWQIESGTGDLVLHSKAQTPEPVEEFRVLIPGCDIAAHTLVWVHGYGVGHTANSPWEGTFLGDPNRDQSPLTFPHPLVCLFQGDGVGWFIEGREPRIGPANVLIRGHGDTASLGFNRRFVPGTTSPELFEVRLRTYQDQWQDAVDPYVRWLQEDAGFVALDALPEEQAWVADLTTQAYIGVGNYEAIDKLAQRVDPSRTLIGRQAEFRHHGFDIAYPDYRLTEEAKKWTRYVRDKGFHVGMHFNCKSVSAMFPELVDRFRSGFAIVGEDEQGQPVYEHLYEGPNTVYRVSAALKDWRQYFIEQMKDAVEAGVDVIYLDESMSPNGKFLIDGVNGYEGILLMMQETLEAYPHVAIETEQFNTLTAKHGKIALSQMPLGHPLAGYIFQRYVKVVPEGVMYSPTDMDMMDAFDNWGFMLPGADPDREESWMRIAEAFHEYDLVPDSRLIDAPLSAYWHHYSSGEVPTIPPAMTEEPLKLFGFRGRDGVTAFLERHPTRRGLVVYRPDAPPQWIGERHMGIREYEGPGVPVMYTFRERVRDWLIYDDGKLLGLDPAQTYWVDPDVERRPERFHVLRVPPDYAGYSSMDRRTYTQEAAHDDAFFFIRFTGHGQIAAHVPDDYNVLLNGRPLEIDRAAKTATATVSASAEGSTGLGYHIELQDGAPPEAVDEVPDEGPATLVAYRRRDEPLRGPWSEWKLYGSHDSLKWIKTQANDFQVSVGTVGRFVGRIPEGQSIRLRGSYRMTDPAIGQPADGVVRINGIEVLRVPHGGRPFTAKPFDVDLSAFAGEHVLFEFGADGSVRGGYADWLDPKIVVE